MNVEVAPLLDVLVAGDAMPMIIPMTVVSIILQTTVSAAAVADAARSGEV